MAAIFWGAAEIMCRAWTNTWSQIFVLQITFCQNSRQFFPASENWWRSSFLTKARGFLLNQSSAKYLYTHLHHSNCAKSSWFLCNHGFWGVFLASMIVTFLNFSQIAMQVSILHSSGRLVYVPAVLDYSGYMYFLWRFFWKFIKSTYNICVHWQISAWLIWMGSNLVKFVIFDYNWWYEYIFTGNSMKYGRNPLGIEASGKLSTSPMSRQFCSPWSNWN